MFIMMEGGWSFDTEENEKAPNDWSSGNVIDTMIMSVGIYLIFIISSKSQLLPNLIFFGFMFLLYLVNTQRNYWLARKEISEETNEKLFNFQVGVFLLSLATLAYGFIDYVLYQKGEYKDKFSWYIFLAGSQKCASLA